MRKLAAVRYFPLVACTVLPFFCIGLDLEFGCLSPFLRFRGWVGWGTNFFYRSPKDAAFRSQRRSRLRTGNFVGPHARAGWWGLRSLLLQVLCRQSFVHWGSILVVVRDLAPYSIPLLLWALSQLPLGMWLELMPITQSQIDSHGFT